MEEDENTGEKTERPSEHRIEEFRERGEVASSKELTMVIVLSATFLTILLSSSYMLEVLTDFFRWSATLDYKEAYKIEKIDILITKVAVTILKAIWPTLLVTVCFAVIGNITQVGFIFAPQVLAFKPERINPVKGLKRLFSKKAIFDTFKGLFKFTLIIAIAYSLLGNRVDTFKGFYHITVVESFLYSKGMMGQLAYSILLGLLLIAIVDFAWEKYLYNKKLFLTRQQAKEELKEKEGSPEVRQRIRAAQRELAQRRMIKEIPNADAIITNPTHVSVAIRYDATRMVSPMVVAKGEEYMALRIREIAKEHDVPIVENVPLARSLYKTVKIGEIVPQSLYKAVAEILAFVYRLKKKKEAVTSKI